MAATHVHAPGNSLNASESGPSGCGTLRSECRFQNRKDRTWGRSNAYGMKDLDALPTDTRYLRHLKVITFGTCKMVTYLPWTPLYILQVAWGT